VPPRTGATLANQREIADASEKIAALQKNKKTSNAAPRKATTTTRRGAANSDHHLVAIYIVISNPKRISV
jgi:hypothetical protein